MSTNIAISLWISLLHLLATFLLLIIVGVLMKEGFKGLLKHTVSLFRLIPGVDSVISAILRREVGSFVKQLGTSASEGDGKSGTERKTMSIPVQG